MIVVKQHFTEYCEIDGKEIEVFVCDNGTRAIPVAAGDSMVGIINNLKCIIVFTKQGFHMTCYELEDVKKALQNKPEIDPKLDITNDDYITHGFTTPMY
jgi:hypothetical protein